MKARITVFLLLSLAFVSCKVKDTPDNFGYGKVEGGKYVNGYFDMEMNIPTEWSVQSRSRWITLRRSARICDQLNEFQELTRSISWSDARRTYCYQHTNGKKGFYQPGYNTTLSIVTKSLSAATSE